jgi:hypothetical protein
MAGDVDGATAGRADDPNWNFGTLPDDVAAVGPKLDVGVVLFGAAEKPKGFAEEPNAESNAELSIVGFAGLADGVVLIVTC